ncbi:SGNH/GDSL hydrolase family protein [Paracoccus aestuariivivens]|uniref:Lipase n=1 Tax=Paracoccus aestuariivivens TaxID=1820333 RepID=A0A6L6JC90_9RHOB|nr:SGNH/GDSL hydrolase family protein [Paracoccus aestuariivivens]MTH79813.1 lipase [Paracoccus aestuariivivens]
MKELAVLTIVFPAVAALLFWSWPEPARPHVPVPQLASETGQGKALVFTDLVPLQQGLTPVPALVTGRASGGAKGALMQEWPGFHAEARFHGTMVTVRFADTVNRWRIQIDDGHTSVIELSRPGVNDLRIRGMPEGEHHIRVEKISESSMPTSFGGIFVDEGSQALPAPDARPKLIEFIGDSDTVGFANTALRRDCTEEEVFSATDTSRSFGPQVAHALDADFRMVARSGIGLVRNYEGVSPQATMTTRYPLALPSEPSATRLADRKADIVVTALGSNDFGSSFTDNEQWSDKDTLSRDFGTALIGFLRDRVRENPGALQVLLAFGEYGDPLVMPYLRAESALKSDGARAVLVTLPKLQRNACLWHPSALDHELIAKQLLAAVSGLM